MFSYDEIDALILNRWRETNDGSFIEQFTDDEIEVMRLKALRSTSASIKRQISAQVIEQIKRALSLITSKNLIS